MRVFVLIAVGLGCACDDASDATPDAMPDSPDAIVDAALPPSTAWATWGADEANSRTNLDEAFLTAANVGQLEVAWSIDGPGVTSTPVVVDDVLYFGRWDGVVQAVNALDGTEIWRTDTGDATVDAAVAVSGGRVFVSVGAHEVLALDRASGGEIWRVSLDAHPATHLFSTPTVIDDLVVVGVAGIELVEVLDDYTFRGSVVGLDAADGVERWRLYTTEDDETAGAGVSVWSSAAVDRGRGLIYIGTGNTYEPPASPLSDALLAIDYATGTLVWHRQFTADDVYTVFGMPPQGPDADVGATPNLFTIDGRDVVGVGDKAGIYSVLDRETGETVWSRMLTAGSPLGGIMTSAAVHEGVIYATSNQWDDIPTIDTDANGALALALDAASGDTLWETPLEAPSFGAVSVAGGVMYCTTVKGRVYALDVTDGRVLWDEARVDRAASGVAIASGMAFVGHGFSLFKAPEDVSGALTAYRVERE